MGALDRIAQLEARVSALEASAKNSIAGIDIVRLIPLESRIVALTRETSDRIAAIVKSEIPDLTPGGSCPRDEQ